MLSNNNNNKAESNTNAKNQKEEKQPPRTFNVIPSDLSESSLAANLIKQWQENNNDNNNNKNQTMDELRSYLSTWHDFSSNENFLMLESISHYDIKNNNNDNTSTSSSAEESSRQRKKASAMLEMIPQCYQTLKKELLASQKHLVLFGNNNHDKNTCIETVSPDQKQVTNEQKQEIPATTSTTEKIPQQKPEEEERPTTDTFLLSLNLHLVPSLQVLDFRHVHFAIPSALERTMEYLLWKAQTSFCSYSSSSSSLITNRQDALSNFDSFSNLYLFQCTFPDIAEFLHRQHVQERREAKKRLEQNNNKNAPNESSSSSSSSSSDDDNNNNDDVYEKLSVDKTSNKVVPTTEKDHHHHHHHDPQPENNDDNNNRSNTAAAAATAGSFNADTAMAQMLLRGIKAAELSPLLPFVVLGKYFGKTLRRLRLVGDEENLKTILKPYHLACVSHHLQELEIATTIDIEEHYQELVAEQTLAAAENQNTKLFEVTKEKLKKQIAERNKNPNKSDRAFDALLSNQKFVSANEMDAEEKKQLQLLEKTNEGKVDGDNETVEDDEETENEVDDENNQQEDDDDAGDFAKCNTNNNNTSKSHFKRNKNNKNNTSTAQFMDAAKQRQDNNAKLLKGPIEVPLARAGALAQSIEADLEQKEKSYQKLHEILLQANNVNNNVNNNSNSVSTTSTPIFTSTATATTKTPTANIPPPPPSPSSPPASPLNSSSTIPKKLLTMWPHLAKLTARGLRWRQIPPVLGNLPSLTYLDLSFNHISSLVLPYPILAQNARLQTVDLSYNRLKFVGDGHSAALPSSVTAVNLSHNRIECFNEGAQPLGLPVLVALRAIDVSSNRLEYWSDFHALVHASWTLRTIKCNNNPFWDSTVVAASSSSDTNISNDVIKNNQDGAVGESKFTENELAMLMLAYTDPACTSLETNGIFYKRNDLDMKKVTELARLHSPLLMKFPIVVARRTGANDTPPTVSEEKELVPSSHDHVTKYYKTTNQNQNNNNNRNDYDENTNQGKEFYSSQYGNPHGSLESRNIYFAAHPHVVCFLSQHENENTDSSISNNNNNNSKINSDEKASALSSHQQEHHHEHSTQCATATTTRTKIIIRNKKVTVLRHRKKDPSQQQTNSSNNNNTDDDEEGHVQTKKMPTSTNTVAGLDKVDGKVNNQQTAAPFASMKNFKKNREFEERYSKLHPEIHKFVERFTHFCSPNEDQDHLQHDHDDDDHEENTPSNNKGISNKKKNLDDDVIINPQAFAHPPQDPHIGSCLLEILYPVNSVFSPLQLLSKTNDNDGFASSFDSDSDDDEETAQRKRKERREARARKIKQVTDEMFKSYSVSAVLYAIGVTEQTQYWQVSLYRRDDLATDFPVHDREATLDGYLLHQSTSSLPGNVLARKKWRAVASFHVPDPLANGCSIKQLAGDNINVPRESNQKESSSSASSQQTSPASPTRLQTENTITRRLTFHPLESGENFIAIYVLASGSPTEVDGVQRFLLGELRNACCSRDVPGTTISLAAVSPWSVMKRPWVIESVASVFHRGMIDGYAAKEESFLMLDKVRREQREALENKQKPIAAGSNNNNTESHQIPSLAQVRFTNFTSQQQQQQQQQLNTSPGLVPFEKVIDRLCPYDFGSSLPGLVHTIVDTAVSVFASSKCYTYEEERLTLLKSSNSQKSNASSTVVAMNQIPPLVHAYHCWAEFSPDRVLRLTPQNKHLLRSYKSVVPSPQDAWLCSECAVKHNSWWSSEILGTSISHVEAPADLSSITIFSIRPVAFNKQERYSVTLRTNSSTATATLLWQLRNVVHPVVLQIKVIPIEVSPPSSGSNKKPENQKIGSCDGVDDEDEYDNDDDIPILFGESLLTHSSSTAVAVASIKNSIRQQLGTMKLIHMESCAISIVPPKLVEPVTSAKHRRHHQDNNNNNAILSDLQQEEAEILQNQFTLTTAKYFLREASSASSSGASNSSNNNKDSSSSVYPAQQVANSTSVIRSIGGNSSASAPPPPPSTTAAENTNANENNNNDDTNDNILFDEFSSLLVANYKEANRIMTEEDEFGDEKSSNSSSNNKSILSNINSLLSQVLVEQPKHFVSASADVFSKIATNTAKVFTLGWITGHDDDDNDNAADESNSNSSSSVSDDEGKNTETNRDDDKITASSSGSSFTRFFSDKFTSLKKKIGAGDDDKKTSQQTSQQLQQHQDPQQLAHLEQMKKEYKNLQEKIMMRILRQNTLNRRMRTFSQPDWMAFDCPGKIAWCGGWICEVMLPLSLSESSTSSSSTTSVAKRAIAFVIDKQFGRRHETCSSPSASTRRKGLFCAVIRKEDIEIVHVPTVNNNDAMANVLLPRSASAPFVFLIKARVVPLSLLVSNNNNNNNTSDDSLLPPSIMMKFCVATQQRSSYLRILNSILTSSPSGTTTTTTTSNNSNDPASPLFPILQTQVNIVGVPNWEEVMPTVNRKRGVKRAKNSDANNASKTAASNASIVPKTLAIVRK